MRRFSLAQLEAFRWICRLGTFHAAAERLNVTQPSVSQRIRELESAIDAKLFERRGSGVRLTAEGEILLRYTEQGLSLFDEMEDRLRTGDPLQGTLRVGASETVAMTCLPDMISSLEAHYPKLRVELNVRNSTMLWDLLMRKKLDVAFLTDARQHRSIHIEPLGRTEVAWFSSPGRRLVEGRPLRPSDLEGVSILSMPAPSPLNDMLVNWCTSNGAPPPAFSTCNNIAVIARLLIAGVAASILPVCTVQSEVDSGALLRYDPHPTLPPRTLCAAYPVSARGPGMDALLENAHRALADTGLFYSPH
ncbi:LysR family transcriptional regulator [Candidimonas nitroreducens]|uniref:HTH lysR-type domain-containing protein n=1 Tax=Candidimonas nitroreducens TaxID=683354 RepID=A0A225MX07_9BURK|nr:LysR family transcriptional regulator [Candidimonas nitroreducens]OWT65765.1 hypothetical protein CEY11_03285 [Candidimonas nitroreducens]